MKRIVMAEKRYGVYANDNVVSSLKASSGSVGGGSEGLVIEIGEKDEEKGTWSDSGLLKPTDK